MMNLKDDGKKKSYVSYEGSRGGNDGDGMEKGKTHTRHDHLSFLRHHCRVSPLQTLQFSLQRMKDEG